MERAFDFNLRHLDAVVSVGRHGTIRAASHEVNLSQPAITQAVAKLEASLGCRLFDRLSNGMGVAEAGRIFLPRAAWAVEELTEAARSLRRSARLKPFGFPERTLSMVQFRALLAVKRAGSYSVGGRLLGLSQPSVRRAVKELEDTLGVPLLVRVGRTMRTTAAAERLLRSVRLAVNELEAGIDDLAALVRSGSGRVKIGTLPLPRAALLPEALSRFALENPSAAVTVVEGGYSELAAELRNGGIDMLIGALRDPLPHTDLVQEPLLTEELFIVARAGHVLAGQERPAAEALAAFPWVIGASGAPMRSVWETMFINAQSPQIRIESASILVARGLLLRGDWLALMSRDQFSIEQSAGLLTAIGPAVLGSGREIGISTRKDWRPTATQAAFMAALRQAARIDPLKL
jgi:LysR family transcriptional regulator of gallate degradation